MRRVSALNLLSSIEAGSCALRKSGSILMDAGRHNSVKGRGL